MKNPALSSTDLMSTPNVTTAGTLMNSSEDLVARVRAGDEAAFRLIFERYARPILKFVYDLVGERQLAEDLTQETFVRAYRNLGQLRSETKLSTWLFGIAKNVARESIRARCRDSRRIATDESCVTELVDSTAQPDDQLVNRELNGVIHEALAALEEDKRVVFTLKVFHGRSYEEIAEITGFSVPKLKTDLHRARLEMRRRVAAYLEVV